MITSEKVFKFVEKLRDNVPADLACKTNPNSRGGR